MYLYRISMLGNQRAKSAQGLLEVPFFWQGECVHMNTCMSVSHIKLVKNVVIYNIADLPSIPFLARSTPLPSSTCPSCRGEGGGNRVSVMGE